MGKKNNLKTEFKVAYVPLPESMKEARRASLLLLLEWIEEDIATENELGEKTPSSPESGMKALQRLA